MALFGKGQGTPRAGAIREYGAFEACWPPVDTDLTGPEDDKQGNSTGRTGRRGRGPTSWVRDGVALLAFMVAVGAGRSSVADHYFVPTGSMIPTVEVGDRVVVNKLAYGLRLPFTSVHLLPFSGPQPGEVVVLRSPEQDDVTLLKRVVAVPGDEVAVRQGLLYINGVRAPVARDEQGFWEDLGTGAHGLRLTGGGGLDFGPVRVGPGEYLVMGDNRGESHDGRAFGLVERQAIIGRALSVWMRHGGLTWKKL